MHRLSNIFIIICVGLALLCIKITVNASTLLPVPTFSNKIKADSLASPLLTNETFRRGIFFQHSQQSNGLNGLNETLGSGACVLDFNNDNNMDIYFVAGSGATRFYGKQHWWSNQVPGHLYQNTGDGYFKLVLTSVGLSDIQHGIGCNSADIDNDGHYDLIVTGQNENWIAYGDGKGNFESTNLDKSKKWSNSATLIDVNNDGLLDIYIGNYIKYKRNDKTLEINTGFDDDNSSFHPENFPAQGNTLYINKGNRQFLESTQIYNLSNSDGRTLGANWIDSNNDQWPDLFVINDSGSEPQLFLNQQGKYFVPAPLTQQLTSLSGIHNSTTYTFNDNPSAASSIFTTRIGSPPYMIIPNKEQNENMTWEKILNNDKLEGKNQWGVASVDLNGDGLLDLYIGSGLVTPNKDAPRIPQGQPDSILLQNSKGQLFKQNHDNHISLSTRTVIASDIDNDGDSDLILTHNNGPAIIKINHSNPKYWIGLDIKNENNFKNIYKKIKIKQEEKTYWLHPKQNSFLGNQDYRQLITLKNDARVDVRIFWLNGNTSDFLELNVDAYHLISEDSTTQPIKKITYKKSRKIPIDLALWQIKANMVKQKDIIETFETENIKNKELILKQSFESKNDLLTLALIETSQNKRHPLSNINEILTKLELEVSVPLILNQIENSLDCSTTEMIKTWYLEEESMVLSKKIFTNQLIKKLKGSKPSLQSCILMALAESRQFRPVVAIEELLMNSKNDQVRKSAIHSLGKLRRTRSIPLVKSFIEHSTLSKEAKIALNRLNSKLAIDNPSINTDKINLKQATTKIIKESSVCPRMNIEKILTLKQNELTTIFSLCSNSSLRAWLHKNKNIVVSNIEFFISNQNLSKSQLSALLDIVQDEKIKGFHLILSGLINQTLSLDLKGIILKAMYPYRDYDAVQAVALNILTDNNLPGELRISAGNILIDKKPELVIANSNSIFYE